MRGTRIRPLYTEGVKPVSREREGAESDFSSGIPATGMERLWSLAGATSGNRWQIGRPRKRRNQAKTVAIGCDQLPWDLDGKEGVDGSSPSEGSSKRKIPGNRGFLLSNTAPQSSSRHALPSHTEHRTTHTTGPPGGAGVGVVVDRHLGEVHLVGGLHAVEGAPTWRSASGCSSAAGHRRTGHRRHRHRALPARRAVLA